MKRYIRCAWANVVTRLGFVLLILSIVLICTGSTWWQGPLSTTAILLGITKNGTETLEAYEKTHELYNLYGRHDRRYLNLVEAEYLYCKSAGVKLAMKDIAKGKAIT